MPELPENTTDLALADWQQLVDTAVSEAAEQLAERDRQAGQLPPEPIPEPPGVESELPEIEPIVPVPPELPAEPSESEPF